ncbi:hypothetical protein OE88DRAFT_780012 [Heliocybe sulcata]|uniref:F-box domain-containing protein n=1 Tax=Heliocybe sulcata TaxID=5364 RepID=A0A5C3N1K9_9AGAM|nr:hypothetical protein OE88DRAFT_780012 [Heliocybe sulcata]
MAHDPGRPSDLRSLMLVCKYWQEIVQSTQALWTSVILVRPQSFLQTDVLRDRLRRSGNLPLDVKLLCRCVPERVMLPVIEALVDHLPRLRSLDILHQHRQTLFAAVDRLGVMQGAGVRRPAPALQTLRLDWHASGGEQLMSGHGHGVEGGASQLGCPALTELQLPVAVIFTDRSVLSRLTVLRFHAAPTHTSSLPEESIGELLDTLEACGNLRVFSWLGPHLQPIGQPHYFHNGRVVSMPRLRSVEVTTPGPGIDILYYLHAPRLQDLHLNGSMIWGRSKGLLHDWAQGQDRVLQMLASRSPEISRIFLYKIPLYETSHVFKIIFTQFKELRHLSVDTSELTEIPGRVSAVGRKVVCEKLQALELRQCYWVSKRSLKAFLKEGVKLGCPMPHVRVEDCSFTWAELFE